MARPERFELPTRWFEASDSIAGFPFNINKLTYAFYPTSRTDASSAAL